MQSAQPLRRWHVAGTDHHLTQPLDGPTSSVTRGRARDPVVGANPSTTTAHWGDAYARGEQALSWYAPNAAVSLRLITAAKVATSAAVIDIGGTSRLVDASIELGFPNQVDRDAYLCALNGGTASGSVAVFTTFSPDGPTQC